MSFVDNLYNCFTTVCKNAGKSKRSVEDIVRFFRLRVEVEEDHMRGLEKLANFSMMIQEGTILNAVNALKNDCYSRAFQAKTFIESINTDIITVLNNIQKSQSDAIRPYYMEAQKIQRIKDGYLDEIQNCKKKYWKSCQECEKITNALEEVLNQKEREKLLSKLAIEKHNLDENLMNYQDSVESYKKFKAGVKDAMTPVMNVYELQEKERLESIKDSLRKLVVYDTSYIRNIQYDLDTLAHYMESINPYSDIKLMIDESQSEFGEYPDIDFESYNGEHPAFKNFSSTLITIPVPLQEKWAEVPILGSIREMYESNLEITAVKVFKGKDLNSQDFQQFNTLVKDSIGRKAWLNVLSTKPSKLIGRGLEFLAELMISLLNECERVSDADIVKQVLKYINTFTDDSGETLLKFLKVHSIWGKLEIWEKVITQHIQEEIEAREVYKIFDSIEVQESVIKNIVFCQLGSIASHMCNFQVEKMYAGEILSKHACKYNLSAEDIDTLMATVDPTQKRPDPAEIITSVQRGVPDWLKSITTPPPKRSQSKPLGKFIFDT
ncbi:hypothetical protein SteCoe_17859 [Stentor coeruleus]|uniref:F-BAR domain-containing protein n=1 Tax=Stentor coeruleus TaxID=5963 RepID=A0A1R2BXV0_9CILI|nr:hypothetical protein SteCoe_17859 [Stentor coeruleus]